jgi:predicted secreted protein
MATHHGKEGVVTSAGTAIDGVTGFTLDTTHDTVEDTQLNSTTKSFLAGRGTFTGSIDMNYDETDTPQTTLLTGTTLAFVFLPEGNTTGDESFSGSGIVTGMSISVPLDGVVTRTVSFQGTGALTIGTVS